MINNKDEFIMKSVGSGKERQELFESVKEKMQERMDNAFQINLSLPSEDITEIETLNRIIGDENIVNRVIGQEIPAYVEKQQPVKDIHFEAGTGAGCLFNNTVKNAHEYNKKYRLMPRNSPISVAQAIEGMKVINPELWERFRPPVYKGVDAFHDPRCMALHLLGLYVFYLKLGVEDNQETAEILMALARGLPLKFPLYFVTRDVFEACLNSDTLPEIDWLNMSFPVEQMNFVLPKNVFKLQGFYLTCISVTRIKKGMYKIPGLDPFGVDENFLIFHIIDERFLNYRRVMNAPYIPGQTFFPSFYLEENNPYELPLNKDEEEILNRLTNLTFNLILLMLARPELVEMGREVKAHHKKSGNAIWTPNIIGAKYRRPTKPAFGTHSSPVMHLRKGYFRLQWIGKREKVEEEETFIVNGEVITKTVTHYRYKDSKIIFIEPVWVGAQKHNGKFDKQIK